MKLKELRKAAEIENEKAEAEALYKRLHPQFDYDMRQSAYVSMAIAETALKLEPLLREKWQKLNEAVELLKRVYDPRDPFTGEDLFKDEIDNFLKGLENED